MSIEQQRYRVIERLAAGGMAEVFLGGSAGLEGFKKLVAIKRVLPHLSETKRFIAMFLDEARLSAHLSHSNIVQVFDIGVGERTYFIVMEYVDGADLKALNTYLRREGRPFPFEAAVHIAIKVCQGLDYAHAQTNSEGEPLNAVHRDMSPPNVLISKHGEVKITDFGLAKASTQLEKSEAGIIKGKFSYLSPEAAFGKEVDARADVFATGILLWEMLAARRMFQGETDFDTVKLVQKTKYEPLSVLRPDIGDVLDSILARALARDPDERYPTARDLGHDLNRVLFEMGRPVGAFDIAALVREAMAAKQGARGPAVSLIDKLIQETLFEFTSLQNDEAELESSPQSNRLELASFADFSTVSSGPTSSPRHSELLIKSSLPEGAFEEGNLAALEGPDEPIPDSVRSRPGERFSPEPSPPPPPSAPAAPEAGRPAAKSNTLISTKDDGGAQAQAIRKAREASAMAAPSPSNKPVRRSSRPASGFDATRAVLIAVIVFGAVAALWFSGVL